MRFNEAIKDLMEIKNKEIFSKEFIESKFDADELIILIEEEMKNLPCNYQIIHLLCDNVFRETRKEEGYNPVFEDIFIKQGFLMECLGMDAIIFEALVILLGNSPELAYRLEFCTSDDRFNYFVKMYNKYIEQFNSIYTIAREFSNVNTLITEGDRAEELVAKLKELTGQSE